jgi:hypothetical protein
MALPHVYDEVIQKISRITGDVNFIRWSKDELIDYINEGQREYCEKTMILRAEGPLTTRENSEIYNLPEDCFMVDRVERPDGHVIYKTTSRDLLRQYGTKYRHYTGNPESYYQDLDGQKQLRFYPTPTEDMRSVYADFTGELGAVTGVDIVTIDPLIVDNVQVYDESDPLYIANAEPADFDSELGLTTDSTLTDDNTDEGVDSNTFNYEEGVVTGVIDNSGKVRVFYVRYPRVDYLEIDDEQALRNYALHKCYEKDGPQMNPQLSIMYEDKFEERVNREIGRVSSGQHANISTQGYYG